VRQSTCN